MSEITKPIDAGAVQYTPAPFWVTRNGREDLTPREQRSLERVAVYRGLAGKYRRALLDLRDQCAPGTVAAGIIDTALEEQP